MAAVVLAVALAGPVALLACSPSTVPPVQATAGDPARGPAAIDAYGCGSCHVIPGVRGATGTVGPPLTDWSRRGFIAGELPNTPDNLVRWIMDPQAVEPGTAMPNLGVTRRDAEDIAAYLFTLGS